jgi:hypothetical protein
MQHIEVGVCIINIFDTREQKPERKRFKVKVGLVDNEHKKLIISSYVLHANSAFTPQH